jgi:hypothetical protein
MMLAAAAGPNEGAMRSAVVLAAGSLDGARVRRVGLVDVGGALRVVGLLLIGLILISAGCGPPN